MEMDNNYLRTVIHYCWLRKLNGAETAKEINKTIGDKTVSERTCQRWIKEFDSGNFNIDDKERTGRPSLDVDIKAHLMDFPRATSRQIANHFDMSKTAVCDHMHKLGLQYMSCNWVPCLLSDANKLKRLRICNQLLFDNNTSNFLQRLITVDETWIMWDNEGTFHQNKCWAGGDVAKVKNVTKKLTPNKSMAIFFWDVKGVIFWKLLESNQTMTSDVYCEMLEELKRALQSQRRRSLDTTNHGIKILQDNARPHVARATITKLNEINLPCIPHPPYSPDLSPSDFHLFPSLKAFMCGEKFQNRNEVEQFVIKWIDSKNTSFFQKGFDVLPEKWQKCVDVDGNYF